MFKLSLGDLWRGLVMSVMGAVAVAVLGVFSRVITSDFDVFSLDYIALFKELTNQIIIAGYGAGSGYLMKNLLTDDNQNFLGIPTKS
jgi:hypothetical protein